MRRRMITILSILAIGAGAFVAGRVSVQPTPVRASETLNLENDADYELACEFVDKIVDWNVVDDEIAILTDDDYELYAQRSVNVYENMLEK